MSSVNHEKSRQPGICIHNTKSLYQASRLNKPKRSPLCKQWSDVRHILVVAVMTAAGVGMSSTRVNAFDTIYVRASATGNNDGTSWGDAFTDLQEALVMALPGDEIWVAAGTYRPAGAGGSREATFQLLNDVALYGGFAGGETSIEQRDISMNETVLSGDLNANDVPVNPASDCCVAHSTPGCDDTACAIEICASIPECCTTSWTAFCAGAANIVCGFCSNGGSTSDNSHHVVRATSVGLTAILDGFSITAGHDHRTSGDWPNGEGIGAGLLNNFASPLISNCSFYGNRAWAIGSGIFNRSSSPHIVGCRFFSNNGVNGSGNGLALGNREGSHPLVSDCLFINNIVDGFGQGGAVYNGDGSAPIFIASQFIHNAATHGGALSNENQSVLTMINCTMNGNSAVGFNGGAIRLGVGTTAHLINCTFSGNTSVGLGGALFSDESNFELLGCTLSHNLASQSGGISASFSTVQIKNSVFWGNSDDLGSGLNAQLVAADGSLEVSYSNIEGSNAAQWGEGNINVAPLFADPLGPDDNPGTADDDLRLAPGSPCIDAGNNTAVPFDTHDLDGDNNTNERTPIDLDGNPRFLDDAATVDTGSGTAPIVDMGAYEFIIDCNQNHIPDSVDIASGTSPDVNQDGVPDDCGNVAAIVDATPPPNAIDARQPHNLDGSNSTGWYFVRLTLSNANQSVGKPQFEVSEQGGDGIAPGIAAVSVQGTQALILFSTPVEPGAWTTVTHIPSGTSTRVGYLPGDVNGDGAATPVDILALIDAINGVTPRPDYATDINRDGTTAPADILREIDLLNGADAFEPWLGRTLP